MLISISVQLLRHTCTFFEIYEIYEIYSKSIYILQLMRKIYLQINEIIILGTLYILQLMRKIYLQINEIIILGTLYKKQAIK